MTWLKIYNLFCMFYTNGNISAFFSPLNNPYWRVFHITQQRQNAFFLSAIV